MKKINDVALNVLKKAAFTNAKREAQTACMFIGYQPKMSEKIKKLKGTK